jgi:hypothetical protein
MNSFYEFIGPPGSGKTFLYKKIRAKIKNKKKIFRGDEYFFKYYYDKEKKNFKYRLYYHYKRKFKFESNLLFKKEYKFLNQQINLIIKKNRLKKIINKLKIILSYTELNSDGVKRTLDNFRINLIIHYFEKKNNMNILNDEGLIQSLFQIYKFELKKKQLKIIEDFLKLLPKFKSIFLLKVSKKNLIIRTINRREGFKYRIDDIDILLKNFDNITLVIKKILKKRKINFFCLNNNNLDGKSLIELEKKI